MKRPRERQVECSGSATGPFPQLSFGGRPNADTPSGPFAERLRPLARSIF